MPRHLSRIIGKRRTPGTYAGEPAIERWLEQQAARFDCSKSLVRLNCLSLVSGIPLQCEKDRIEPKRRASRVVSFQGEQFRRRRA